MHSIGICLVASATLGACGFIDPNVLKASADAYVRARTGQSAPPSYALTSRKATDFTSPPSRAGDPKALPVNHCLSLQPPTNSLDWQDVVNACAFRVTFTYCLQGGSAPFVCGPGNYGKATDSVGPFGRSGMNWAEAAHGSRPSGWIYTACRSDSEGDVMALRKAERTGCY